MILNIHTPDWLNQYKLPDTPYPNMEERVRLTLELTKRNLEEGTGGPFGAIVFDRETWKPVGLGVNLVTSSGISLAHAEVVAIMWTQKKYETFDLSSKNLELVSSCEPCIMCHGAVMWSGINSLVYSADKNDAENIGFDEGDKPQDWQGLFAERGIEVHGPILQSKGRDVLNSYLKKDGVIYNPGRKS